MGFRLNRAMQGLRKIFPCAVIVMLSACSSTPPQQVAVDSQATTSIKSRLTAEQATDVTIYAMSLVGTPYRYGGNTPDTGFDCSGLIGHVYKAQSGVATPRTVNAMGEWGQPVPVDAVRSGDLAIFIQNGVASHAGIYVGNGRFVHAPSTGGTVRLEKLDSGYWSRQLVAYRRP